VGSVMLCKDTGESLTGGGFPRGNFALDPLMRVTQAGNLSAERAFALAASSSRFLGDAVVSRECRRRVEIAAISSIAARKVASLALEGLLKPLIFLTNWSEAARTSSSVTGGSKLKSILMFRHMRKTSDNSLILLF
jgi:hypothetical protein